MKPIPEILVLITFVVAIVVAPIALFRMVRAKTRAVYWKNIALFVGPILLVFFVSNGAGLISEAPTSPSVPPISQNGFENMPAGPLILLAMGAMIWIGGGNLLFYFHNRRLGKKWWQALNPFDPPFKNFNALEWLILGVLVVASLGLMALAISLGQPS